MIKNNRQTLVSLSASGQSIEDNMFKRKNTTDEDDLPQKRSRLSDEASTSGKYILDLYN